MAVAFVSAVLAARGAELLTLFRRAALVGAGACVAAGVAASLCLPGQSEPARESR